MNYAEFCAAVDALLADKPPFTGVRIGVGHVMHDAERNLVAVADGASVEDAAQVDSTSWDDCDGLTGPETDKALADPEFKRFTA